MNVSSDAKESKMSTQETTEAATPKKIKATKQIGEGDETRKGEEGSESSQGRAIRQQGRRRSWN
jgi:hypothetical protein